MTQTQYPIEATIFNEARKQAFLDLFGTDTVPVKSFIPTRDCNGAFYYDMDLTFLTEDMKEKVIVYLAKKHGLPEAFVRAELPRIGIPILAEGCLVSARGGLFF